MSHGKSMLEMLNELVQIWTHNYDFDIQFKRTRTNTHKSWNGSSFNSTSLFWPNYSLLWYHNNNIRTNILLCIYTLFINDLIMYNLLLHYLVYHSVMLTNSLIDSWSRLS